MQLYIFYTSHNMLSSHYSLQRLTLAGVFMTSDNHHHISHYIRTGSQLEELYLWGVGDSDDVYGRYVHN